MVSFDDGDGVECRDLLGKVGASTNEIPRLKIVQINGVYDADNSPISCAALALQLLRRFLGPKRKI